MHKFVPSAVVLFSTLVLAACGGGPAVLSKLDVTSKLQASAIGCDNSSIGSGGFVPVIKDGEEYSDGSSLVRCDTAGNGSLNIFVYDDKATAQHFFEQFCGSDAAQAEWSSVEEFVWGANWVAYKSGGAASLAEVAEVLGGEAKTADTYCAA